MNDTGKQQLTDLSMNVLIFVLQIYKAGKIQDAFKQHLLCFNTSENLQSCMLSILLKSVGIYLIAARKSLNFVYNRFLTELSIR